jgi:hypothetical protein
MPQCSEVIIPWNESSQFSRPRWSFAFFDLPSWINIQNGELSARDSELSIMHTHTHTMDTLHVGVNSPSSQRSVRSILERYLKLKSSFQRAILEYESGDLNLQVQTSVAEC